ncbi:DUF934 domain-containing protein [Oceaniglobus indicus]|uniref:DUF934 domain-containing protein n=1 Tax=Oceaniglobus indicus TaxID=2047749 RepID=UPI000C19D4F1|nr:DUF934 domain-containing protein [Oceaniglobus indicus]
MSVIVTDTGFGPETLTRGANGAEPLEVTADTDPETLSFDGITAIVVEFTGFSDGRGFTIARRLRQRGYTGRLRARGHVIADQYTMARRCGFDEVEIDAALAARQPEAQWLARADWRAHDYQSRLRGTRDNRAHP